MRQSEGDWDGIGGSLDFVGNVIAHYRATVSRVRASPAPTIYGTSKAIHPCIVEATPCGRPASCLRHDNFLYILYERVLNHQPRQLQRHNRHDPDGHTKDRQDRMLPASHQRTRGVIKIYRRLHCAVPPPTSSIDATCPSTIRIARSACEATMGSCVAIIKVFPVCSRR